MLGFLGLSSKQSAQLCLCCLTMGFLLIAFTIKNEWLFWHDLKALSQKKTSTFQVASVHSISTQSILDSHLFGIALPDRGALPGTQLQIELNGILTAIPSTLSQALISISGQPSRIYHVGDQLLGLNVRIHSIVNEGVILDNGGHLEKLSLQRAVLKFQGLPKSLGS